MIRTTLLLTFILFSLNAISCECARTRFGANFLKQVKNFDAIAQGTIVGNWKDGSVSLRIIKSYKGLKKGDMIRIDNGGTDCNAVVTEEGKKIQIFGLKKSPYSDGYVIPDCVTSYLTVVDGNALVDMETARHMIGNPKIGTSSKMKLDALERKILTKLETVSNKR